MPDHIEKEQQEQARQLNEASLIGRVLGGHYLILEEIGAGGMGHVFRAHDQRLERDVAIKMLHPWLASRDSVIKRFQNEARLLTTLEHRSILRTYGMGVEDGVLYMVMDLVTGESLDKWMKEKRKIDLPTFKVIFADVLDGLAHAHSRGVLHRDIKPSNIIVSTASDGRLQAMLLDFGLAKLLEAPERTAVELTQTGELVGSPMYMSPEQSNGTHIDARSDIYSLCCVMFEALSGAPPFAGDNPLEVLYKHVHETAPDLVTTQGIPIRLAQVIRQGMEKNPGHRHESVAELKADLEHAYSDTSKVQKSGVYRIKHKKREKSRHHKMIVVLAATMFTVLAVAGTLILTNSGKHEESAPPRSALKFDAPPFTLYERFMEGDAKAAITAADWEQLGDYAEQQKDQKTAAQAYLQAADHFNIVDKNPASVMRCTGKGWRMLQISHVWDDTQSPNAAGHLVTIALRERDYAAARSMLDEWYEQSKHLKSQFSVSRCESLQAKLLVDLHRPQEALDKANASFDRLQKLQLAPTAKLAVLEEIASVAHHLHNKELLDKVVDQMANVLNVCEKSLGGTVSHSRLALGSVYADLKKYDQARQSLLAVSKSGTGAEQVQSLRQLGMLELDDKHPDAAEGYFRESFKRLPLDITNRHPHASFGLSCQLTGVSLLQQNKDAAAKSFFEEAMKHYSLDLPRDNPYYSRLEVYGGLKTLADRRNDRADAEHWQQLVSQVEKELEASKKKPAAVDTGTPGPTIP